MNFNQKCLIFAAKLAALIVVPIMWGIMIMCDLFGPPQWFEDPIDII